jgi:hypothetical protein
MREAIAAAPRLASIVHLSTIAGNHDGSWIDETTPLTPTLARAGDRIAAERAGRRLAKRATLRSPSSGSPAFTGPARARSRA